MFSLITARSLLLRADAGELLEDAALLIEDGHIAAIGPRDSLSLPANLPADRCDHYPDGTLSPAFIDIHIHGGLGHDVMEASPASLQTIGRFLATRGVGAYYPTTVTAPLEDTLRSLAGLARIIQQPSPDHHQQAAATPLGIHLEGPFISHEKRGVHPPESIQKPTIALFERFWEASEGTIRLMTIAPEVEGALEVIEHATRLGVRVSLGHSNADTAQARAGMTAGACSATHTFNAMRPLDHRDPGILGIVLDTDKLHAELICDGIHVDPAVVRLFWKAVGRERAILITDGISATGMPDGEYMLGGFRVQVKDGRCMHDGHLAGSVLTLDHAVRNFIDYTRASLADALTLVTRNPAALTGIHPDYGELAVGRSASLNVINHRGEVTATYLQGRRV